VKIIRLNKTLAALGMAVFFIFGAFAVSLAYESAPLGPLDTLELHHLSATDPAQLYSHTMALQFESADVPEAIRLCSEACAFKPGDSIESLTPFHSPQIHAAKVSLQILQSALLL